MVKKPQTGFTLIELVVVVVILGILAAVAAPRFVSLSTDANIAALEGVSATLLSSSNLVLAKANIEGVANEALSNVDIDGDGINDVETIFGYPSADRINGIINVIDLADDWAFGDGRTGTEFYITSASFGGGSGVTNNNIRIRQDNCYVAYIPSTVINTPPTTTFFISGC